ncbi:hypothetical protein [Brevundimonas sp.]|jgi:hypothetical protein|uniref:hypothetical protein n=1 Tax=Brevundimonas sp. TaxID=1871086 RepID=UPI0037BED580
MTAFARQSHRSLAIVFTVAVLLNIGALVVRIEAAWLAFLPLAPLFLMMISGLWLFAAPYLNRRS